MTLIEFANDGTDFSGLYAAREWLMKNGYSYGSLCGDKPVCIMAGDCNIAKWRNLTKQERAQCDGTMTAQYGCFRRDRIIVTVKRIQEAQCS